MPTLTRKQREIRDRETRILAVAREMLASGGYLKLNMDRIAAAIEYAKGTVYQHFKNKEDIVVALDIAAHQQLFELFRRASDFRGGSRHRMTAVGVASNLMNALYPDHMDIIRVTCNPAILEKASPQRRQELEATVGRCLGIVADIARDAMDAGDLELEKGVTPEECVFGLWSLSQGAYAVIASGIPLVEKGVRDPLAALWHNFSKLLDGQGWRPLSSDYDYSMVRRRAWEELFAGDYADFAPAWYRDDG